MSKKEYLNEFVDLSIDYNLLSDLDGNDELLKNFEDFVKRGIFGSKIKTSVFSRIVSSNPSKSPEYRTPFSNRKFKRLLLRLSKMYDLLELKHK